MSPYYNKCLDNSIRKNTYSVATHKRTGDRLIDRIPRNDDFFSTDIHAYLIINIWRISSSAKMLILESTQLKQQPKYFS
jgi:hypothetical protein